MKPTKRKISNKRGILSIVATILIAFSLPLITFWSIEKLLHYAIPLTVETIIAFWIIFIVFKK